MMSDIQYEDYAQALIDKSLATYLSSHNSMKLSDDVVELVKQEDDIPLFQTPVKLEVAICDIQCGCIFEIANSDIQY